MSTYTDKIAELDESKAQLEEDFEVLIQNERNAQNRMLLEHILQCKLNLIDLRKERMTLLEKREAEKHRPKLVYPDF